MKKKISFKSIKNFCECKILKNSQRPLLLIFAIFATSLSVINASLDDLDVVFNSLTQSSCIESSCLNYSQSGLFDEDRHSAFKFIEVADLLGRNTIAIYELYGVLAYGAFKSFDDIGYSAIAVYEFVGETTYIGIKETIKSYKDILGISYNSEEYKQNVLGGKEIVIDSLKKNLKI
jgi:hypothetical protein